MIFAIFGILLLLKSHGISMGVFPRMLYLVYILNGCEIMDWQEDGLFSGNQIVSGNPEIVYLWLEFMFTSPFLI